MEGSFDAYSWQTVERKARFINQVMRGRLDAREIEDIGDNALSFAEVKALASGDPLILEHAQASADLTRLHRLERAWQRSRHTLQGTLTLAEQRIGARERQIAETTPLLARRSDTHGDRFQITINGSVQRERKAAGEQLAQWAARAELGRPEVRVAQLAGLAVTAKAGVDVELAGRALTLRVEGHPDQVTVALAELAANPTGTIQRLENRARGLDAHLEHLTTSLQDARQEAQRARVALTQPFKHADELERARARVAEITEQMKAAGEVPDPRVFPPEPAAIDPGPQQTTVHKSQHPTTYDRPQLARQPTARLDATSHPTSQPPSNSSGRTPATPAAADSSV